jgi:hypothetical protein
MRRKKARDRKLLNILKDFRAPRGNFLTINSTSIWRLASIVRETLKEATTRARNEATSTVAVMGWLRIFDERMSRTIIANITRSAPTAIQLNQVETLSSPFLPRKDGPGCDALLLDSFTVIRVALTIS